MEDREFRAAAWVRWIWIGLGLFFPFMGIMDWIRDRPWTGSLYLLVGILMLVQWGLLGFRPVVSVTAATLTYRPRPLGRARTIDLTEMEWVELRGRSLCFRSTTQAVIKVSLDLMAEDDRVALRDLFENYLDSRDA